MTVLAIRLPFSIWIVGCLSPTVNFLELQMISSHIGYYPWSERWKPQPPDVDAAGVTHRRKTSLTSVSGATTNGGDDSVRTAKAAGDEYRNEMWSAVPLVRIRQQNPMQYIRTAHHLNMYIAESDRREAARLASVEAMKAAIAARNTNPTTITLNDANSYRPSLPTAGHEEPKRPSFVPPLALPTTNSSTAAVHSSPLHLSNTGRDLRSSAIRVANASIAAAQAQSARGAPTNTFNASATGSGSRTARVPTAAPPPPSARQRRSFVTTYRSSIAIDQPTAATGVGSSRGEILAHTKSLKTMRMRQRGKKTSFGADPTSSRATATSDHERSSDRVWAAVAPYTFIRTTRYVSTGHDSFRPFSSRSLAETRPHERYRLPPTENKPYREAIARQTLTERERRLRQPVIPIPAPPPQQKPHAQTLAGAAVHPHPMSSAAQ